MRLNIESLRLVSPSRPTGYLDDVMSAGVIEGAELVLPDEAYAALVAKYKSSPNLLARGMSLAKSLVRWAAAGLPVTSEALLFDRSARCSICPRWDARRQRCLECGCESLKHWLATEVCPLGKW